MASRALAVRRASPMRTRTRTRFLRRVVRRSHKMTIPVAVFAGFLPLASDVGVQLKQGNWMQAANVMEHNVIGVNPWSGKWDTQGFSHGLYPIALGFGVHILAGKLGVNRMLGRMRIPIIRI